MPQPRLWLDEIRDALTKLGGQATLAQLYQEIERRGIMDFASAPNWKAGVRRTIEQHASECAGFTGLAEDDIFFAPQGKGAGIWALRAHMSPQHSAMPDTAVTTDTQLAHAPRVFLSHSHQDNRFASRLATDLQARGADVWVDLTEIQHDDFLKRINEGLKDREWLVLVMTPAALASPWVQLEVDAAHALVILKQMRGVIPMMAKPCPVEDIPPTWATLHRYDATRDYRRALTSLSRALGLVEHETP
jgi:hypothetical protein